jgi:hypothetical protein
MRSIEEHFKIGEHAKIDWKMLQNTENMQALHNSLTSIARFIFVHKHFALE